MHSSFIKGFLKSSTLSAFGTVLMLALHFLTLKLLAKDMPVAQYGLFTLLIVISSGFQVFSSLGLSLTLVKSLSGGVEQRKKHPSGIIIWLRIIQLCFLSTLVLLVGKPILSYFFNASVGALVYFLPPLFIVACVRDTLFAILQGKRRFASHAVVKVVSAAVRFSFVFLLVHYEMLGIRELLWVEIFTAMATILMLLPRAGIVSLIRTGSIRVEAVKDILRFSSPLYADDVCRYFYDRVTVLVLGGLMSSASVAIYGIASKIPEACGKLLTSFLVVYFPSISELMETGRRKEGLKLMNMALVFMSTVLSLVTLMTFFLQDEIVALLFSRQYVEAAPILPMLMLGFIFSCMVNLMTATAVAAGHSSIPVRVSLVSSIVSVVGCVVFIPYWGVMGAVYAQVGSSLVANIVCWFYLKREALIVDILSVMTPIFLAWTLVSVCKMRRWDHPLTSLCTICVYLVVCWVLLPVVRQGCEQCLALVTKIVLRDRE